MILKNNSLNEPIQSYRPSFEFENIYDAPVIGLDEAGCGAWMGPVVAGAAYVAPTCSNEILAALNDSKRLSAKTREDLFDYFESHPHEIKISTGFSTVEEIETLNIRNAAFLAMQRAYEHLSIEASIALIDGTGTPRLPCPSQCIIKGDQRSYSIAAASIAAKVTRDRIILDLHADFPQYGWAKNAGYGTAFHQKAIQNQGITPHHRKTYKPIQAFLVWKKQDPTLSFL